MNSNKTVVFSAASRTAGLQKKSVYLAAEYYRIDTGRRV